MTSQPSPEQSPIQIKTACPKNWAELVGDDKKRFCSECNLHVHNAARLTQVEASTLVAKANSRVCMRIEYDASGAPVFRDSHPAVGIKPRSASRFARWALSAAAGLLAACNGSIPTPAATDPVPGTNGGETPSKMGKVVSTELGDVAVPLPAPIERLGEANVVHPPPEPSTQPIPPVNDGK